MQILFSDRAPETPVTFVVMISRYQGQWVLCVHRQRDTFEFPGGHRERGETPQEAARRELFEETGATEASFLPMGYYCCLKEGQTPSWARFRRRDPKTGPMPKSEIEKVVLDRTLRLSRSGTMPHSAAFAGQVLCLRLF
jgi:8-oxo-dGTP diphosphatase